MSPASNLTWSAKPLSAEEAATVAIRDAILSGRLVPGQRLAQAELAAQLGISRIPLAMPFEGWMAILSPSMAGEGVGSPALR